MAKYKNIVITNSGLALIAAAHSGDTIEFTNVKVGSGVYNGAEVLEDMTALKSVQHSFGINGITRYGTVVKVRSVFSNESVTEGYYITEIGLYAKGSTGAEILFAVIIAEDNRADYFTAYLVAPQSITVEMYITVTGITEGVTFTASPIEGVYATVQDLEDFRVEVDALKKSVSDGKILVAGAITNKGINTATDATFATMASNIAAIKTNPTLQAKTATLSTIAQTILADTGYDGLSQVTVPAITGTAAAGNVLAGKTFSSASGINQTGTIPEKAATTYTPGDSSQTISAGQYLSGVQTISAVPTETKTVTAGTSATTVNRTSGKYMTSVTVNPTPSHSKTVTMTSSPLTITPDSGKLLSSVTVNANLGRGYATGTTSDANTVVHIAANQRFFVYTYSYGATSYYGDFQHVAIVNHGLGFTPSMVRITWNYSNFVYRTILTSNTSMGTLIINAPGQGNHCYTIQEVINNVHNGIPVLMNATSFYFYAMNFGSMFGNLTGATWEAWE